MVAVTLSIYVLCLHLHGTHLVKLFDCQGDVTSHFKRIMYSLLQHIYKRCSQKNATCMTEEENLPAQLQVPPEPLIDENQFDPESHYNTRKRKYVYASQTSDKGSITDSQISNWSQTSEFLWHREVHVLIINLVMLITV
ncbi:uncharacterized protein LOC143076274 [Mytilus galloprovincialis]|uniref:uncharacterized protein LOC143076274 n=1 Tax=Mytilus galloprovincialis TaxID=29158 RepID=UPI003F7C232F